MIFPCFTYILNKYIPIPNEDKELSQDYNDSCPPTFMDKALELAQQAFQQDEVPVGCVIVSQEKIIGAAGNQPRRRGNPAWFAPMAHFHVTPCIF